MKIKISKHIVERLSRISMSIPEIEDVILSTSPISQYIREGKLYWKYLMPTSDIVVCGREKGQITLVTILNQLY